MGEEAAPSVVADRLDVTYRVFHDQRPTLRRRLAAGFRTRPSQDVHAVRDVSFVLRRGESLGLIGSNGSGKSTLLRTVAGLQPATSGTVHARSVPVLLGVQAALQQELSGRRNIELGGTALGLSRVEVADRFDEIVDFAGLRDAIDMPLRAYSSGMVARLHFSIATAVSPEILLVDEALATGDAAFQSRSSERIAQLLEQAGTVAVVSHNLNKIRDLCTRAIWLEQGVVREDGHPDQVIAAYKEHVATMT